MRLQAQLAFTFNVMSLLVAANLYAQELTPFQSQVLGATKITLMELAKKYHERCNSTLQIVCEIGRVDVLDEVLERWENTPVYGKYAVGVMKWQTKMSMAIANMADNYVAEHGRLDSRFDIELRRRMAADPTFQPPKEYLCRHMFGTPHLYGSRGDFCK